MARYRGLRWPPSPECRGCVARDREIEAMRLAAERGCVAWTRLLDDLRAGLAGIAEGQCSAREAAERAQATLATAGVRT